MTAHECIHEDQIHEYSQKITELETKNGFKDTRINELMENDIRIEKKLDKLNDTLNKVVLNSIKDDKDIANRVTTLETKFDTQNETFDKARKEEREKTNQHLTVIGVAMGILSFVFAYILK